MLIYDHSFKYCKASTQADCFFLHCFSKPHVHSTALRQKDCGQIKITQQLNSPSLAHHESKQRYHFRCFSVHPGAPVWFSICKKNIITFFLSFFLSQTHSAAIRLHEDHRHPCDRQWHVPLCGHKHSWKLLSDGQTQCSG